MAVPRGPTTRLTGYWERVYRIPCCPLDRSPSSLHGPCVQLHLVGLRRSLVSSYGGNSGSPVFFFLSSEGTPGVLRLNRPRVLRLAGVIQGSFLAFHPIVGV